MPAKPHSSQSWGQHQGTNPAGLHRKGWLWETEGFKQLTAGAFSTEREQSGLKTERQVYLLLGINTFQPTRLELR